MLRITRVSALFLLLVAICSIGSTTPARASFGDCNSSVYLALFDTRFESEPGFLCVESERVAVVSDAGTTHIRIVQHLLSDWATRPGAVRAIKDGVDGAVRAMTRLGHFRIPDVTILLVDGFTPGVGKERFGDARFGEVAAWARSSGDECRITIFLLGAGATATNGASAVAHELFHCIEYASLSHEQMLADGGDWWVEGSADWFATAAVPASPFLADRVASFDERSPTTSLTSMSYDGYVFFAWLGGARGHDGVMPFLHRMASTHGAAAQHAAMARALPAADWLRFAEAYLDRDIRDGQGASINSTPVDGESLEWSDTQTRRVDLAPFTLVRRSLAFRCGRWTVAPRPARFHAAKPGDGDWADLPGDLNNLGNDRGEFRFVGFNASTDAVPLQLAGTLAARCEVCAGVREVDACMIGTWRMTADGAEQWARENLPNYRSTGISQVGNTLTLNADGTFTTGASSVTARGELGESRATGRMSGQASGRWSTSGGQLHQCFDAASAGGSVTVTTRGQTITTPTTAAIPPVASTAYSCAAGAFTQTIPMGGRGSVTSTYTRVH